MISNILSNLESLSGECILNQFIFNSHLSYLKYSFLFFKLVSNENFTSNSFIFLYRNNQKIILQQKRT